MPNPPKALRCDCGYHLRVEKKYDNCHFFKEPECPELNDFDMQQIIKWIDDDVGRDDSFHYAVSQVNKLRCGICNVFKLKEIIKCSHSQENPEKVLKLETTLPIF